MHLLHTPLTYLEFPIIIVYLIIIISITIQLYNWYMRNVLIVENVLGLSKNLVSVVF